MLIANYMPLFSVLKSLSRHQRRIILRHLSVPAYESFYACISRILYPPINSLSRRQKKYFIAKFKKYKGGLRRLVRRKYSRREKRKILLRLGSEAVLHILRIALPSINRLIRAKKNQAVTSE